jgi:hypothetical protein
MSSIVSIKNLAMVFLFLVLISSLFLTVYDMIVNIPIQPSISLVLGSGIGYCLTILGLNHGIDVVNGTIRDTVTGALNAIPQQHNKIDG